MAEIVTAVISAVVALGAALLAHKRSSKAMADESNIKHQLVSNEQFETVYEAYEVLIQRLRTELDQTTDAAKQERASHQLELRRLYDIINVLESDE